MAIGKSNKIDFLEEKIEEGEVYSKNYEPEREWMQIMLMPNGNGGFLHLPMFFHDDEDWTLSIKKVNEKGEEKTRILYVPKQVYNEYNVGDYFCVSPDCSDEDDIEKSRRE